ncbi:hypothetical protein EV426DRAFT_310350 [Tirmania nivea]|nr:hypothetical protein EV426DRAFT_310350 [Tirmania nivea]
MKIIFQFSMWILLLSVMYELVPSQKYETAPRQKCCDRSGIEIPTRQETFHGLTFETDATEFVTKTDATEFVTKTDATEFVTKTEFAEFKKEFNTQIQELKTQIEAIRKAIDTLLKAEEEKAEKEKAEKEKAEKEIEKSKDWKQISNSWSLIAWAMDKFGQAVPTWLLITLGILVYVQWTIIIPVRNHQWARELVQSAAHKPHTKPMVIKSGTLMKQEAKREPEPVPWSTKLEALFR